MNTILDIKNLSKNFKAVQALNDVSFSINRGEIFGLVGPDGAGKSTLIYIASGLLRTKEGSVTLLGTDVLKYPEKIKTQISILPQGLGLSLAAELSIEENINYFADINHVDPVQREKRKAELLDATQLTPFKDRQAKNLSGGMKQKLGFCCALISSPKFLFLDEPTTGVDPISRRDIWFLINRIIKEEDITVFLTSSYMDEAERCHRIALMHKGQLLALGTMDELTSQLKGQFLEIYVDNQQKALDVFKKDKDIKDIYTVGDKLKAFCVQDVDISSIKNDAVKNDIKVENIDKTSPGLEDVFLTKIMSSSTGINQHALDEFFILDTKSEFTAGPDDVMIEVKNLYKYFGKFAAVNDVTFSVKKGEIFGFLGPNGAGKTTTIKMLCGLFPPSSGLGRIGGFDIGRDQMSIKKNIGYMSQKFSLYRDLTVSENIELYGSIYGVPRDVLKKREGLILEIADLSGRGGAITGDLPMGIKQRLALGCAIIHKPGVIFLDEPTSGVDPIARRLFWDIIFYLSRRMGITVLVTTHYMDEAEHCDRLSLMNFGKLIAIGSPDQLKEEVKEKIGVMLEVQVDKPFDAVDILSKQYEFCTLFARTIHLYTKDPQKDAKAIVNMLAGKGIKVVDMCQKIMPFEDVFVYFCENSDKQNQIQKV
ncbi:MAG: ATP-binding cassette domain-containing protein [Armatimonadota bacterium]